MSGQLIGVPLKDELGPVSIAFSPDGKQIVSGSNDGTICLWDATSGELFGTPPKNDPRPVASVIGHTSGVSSVTFSPNGKLIVSASYDGTLCLWDAAGGQLVAFHEGHMDWVTSVAFSSDGKKIVSGSRDGAVFLWDAASGPLIGSPLKHPVDSNCRMFGRDSSVSVTFSSDGKLICGTYYGTIHLWDAVSGQLVGSPLKTHSGRVISIAFSQV